MWKKMVNYRLIINPVAGNGSSLKAVPAIEQYLNSFGLDYDIVLTEKPGHAVQLAYQAVKDGCEVVVGGGGDGTANEIINGLMLAKKDGLGDTAMGMLAIGRGNDFAYSMGVPVDLKAGCEALVKAKGKKIDVGRVEGGLYPDGRYFGNGVGIGFDAVVGFEAAKLSRLSGMPGYVVAAFKTIFLFFKAPLLEINLNGSTITQACLMVSIMNGRRMGGTFFMAPNGISDDGFFDVIIAGQVSRLGIFSLIPRFMKGTQAGHPAITIEKTAKIKVRAIKGSIPAHADGETICTEGSELSIELLPSQIKLIT
jgi:YegS/Rv2252/BmrU family lipid kinase